ncbi:MAG: cation diffusion facilitator family transporter [Chloroflexota bacterium]|nr:cation diffusion facilitator family transporter [Chloroflexota bacterium]
MNPQGDVRHHGRRPDDRGHIHGLVDPSITSTQRGIWAIKWSMIGLAITAVLQLGIVALSGSVALLADTVHNFGDAFTAVPLWIAFRLALRRPSARFTYGYGRAEDLVGVVIVLIILFSALLAGYTAIDRLLHPREMGYVWLVMAAGAIGFVGNEAVALFRIRVGKQIDSAALVADGYHARIDGLTSLAVLAGAVGVWLGFPMADPIVGLLITVLIFRVVWDSAKVVLTRLLDGVDSSVVGEIRHAAEHVDGVQAVTDVRTRWLGHRLEAELHVTVRSDLSVEEGHTLARAVEHELLHNMSSPSRATAHVDPCCASGASCHHIERHQHDGLPLHSH